MIKLCRLGEKGWKDPHTHIHRLIITCGDCSLISPAALPMIWIPRTFSSGSKVTSFIAVLGLSSGFISHGPYHKLVNLLVKHLIFFVPYLATASSSVNPTVPITGLENTTVGTFSKSPLAFGMLWNSLRINRVTANQNKELI